MSFDNDNGKEYKLDMGRGCRFDCGEEASARVVEGCFKLHETDWLAGYPDNFPTDIFEVRFKNTRRSYYRNVNGLQLNRGDIVAVEASPGHDIGVISLTGDMVARQMKRVGFNPQNGEFKKIYRKAKAYDIEKWQEAIALEHPTMIKARQIAADMNLNMKIGDVEYQGDRIKAIFYYIADERVDFRELIKVFAEQFRIRVEMKQIGARQEAGRIGGIGACGRELCCASWISSFSSVVTTAARTQDISLNPQKLAGQCSKLKCCLIYELDSYIDARKDFPHVNQPLQALDGEWYHVKSDILGRTMSFSSSPDAMVGVITLSVSRVKEIIDINRRGKKVDKLEGENSRSARVEEEPGFVNVIGEESITRFDKKNRNKKKRKGQAVQGPAGENSEGGRNRENRRRGNRQPNGEGRQGGGENRQQSGEGRQGGGENRQQSGEGRQGGGENRQQSGEGRQGGGENRQPNGEGRQGGGENRQQNGEGRQGGGENRQQSGGGRRDNNGRPQRNNNRHNRPQRGNRPQEGRPENDKTE